MKRLQYSIRSLALVTLVVCIWLSLLITHTQFATQMAGWSFIGVLVLCFLRFQYWWFRNDTPPEERLRNTPRFIWLFMLPVVAYAYGPHVAPDYPVATNSSLWLIGPEVADLTIPEWYASLWNNEIWSWRNR